jgi:hypothetical protein
LVGLAILTKAVVLAGLVDLIGLVGSALPALLRSKLVVVREGLRVASLCEGMQKGGQRRSEKSEEGE